MGFQAVIFDLDDTLIVEADTARASTERVAAIVDKTDATAVADLLFESAREIWRSGPHLQLCLELGIASWEGLWSTFEGNYPSLDGVRDWAFEYRHTAWHEGLRRLGMDDPALAMRMSSTFIEAQRNGHRPIEGAASLVHTLARRSPLGLMTNGPSDLQRHTLTRSHAPALPTASTRS